MQARLQVLMESSLDFQAHCVTYVRNGQMSRSDRRLPRFFVTVGSEIVFDYPKEASDDAKARYLWDSGIDRISDLIEEYVQRAPERLLDGFEGDEWGLTLLLLAYDRRLGTRRLRRLREMVSDERVINIIDGRLSGIMEEN